MFKVGDKPVTGYCLEKFLGRGGFGEVWQASGPGGTSAALKIVNLATEEGFKEYRGIQRVKQLQHPNLVPITGIWMLDEQGRLISDDVVRELTAASVSPAGESIRATTLVVAMMLADCNLEQRLAACQDGGATGIPVGELLNYLEDAAKGIDFLNQLKSKVAGQIAAVQHGDIKPQNILLIGGAAMVGDFGLARVLGNRATQSMMAGSPAYMAPECFEGDASSGHADQYSLAIAYVELRSGKAVIDAPTPMAMMNAHLKGDLNLADLLPAERVVIERATARKPDARFATCGDLVRQLRKAVERDQSEQHSMLVELSQQKTQQRHRTTVVASFVGAAFVVIAGAFGVAWSRGDRQVSSHGVETTSTASPSSAPLPISAESVLANEAKESGGPDTTQETDPGKVSEAADEEPHYTYSEVVSCVFDDLARQPKQDREHLRYLTLAQVVGLKQGSNIKGYYDVLQELLDCWATDRPVSLAAIGLNDSVLRLDLRTISWDDATWEELVTACPYAFKTHGLRTSSIEAETKSASAILRGDWLVYHVVTGHAPALPNGTSLEKLGREAVNRIDSIVANYRAALPRGRLAAELGIREKELESLRAQVVPSATAKTILMQATAIPRSTIEQEFIELVSLLGLGERLPARTSNEVASTNEAATRKDGNADESEAASSSEISKTSEFIGDPIHASRPISDWIARLLVPSTHDEAMQMLLAASEVHDEVVLQLIDGLTLQTVMPAEALSMFTRERDKEEYVLSLAVFGPAEGTSYGGMLNQLIKLSPRETISREFSSQLGMPNLHSEPETDSLPKRPKSRRSTELDEFRSMFGSDGSDPEAHPDLAVGEPGAFLNLDELGLMFLFDETNGVQEPPYPRSLWSMDSNKLNSRNDGEWGLDVSATPELEQRLRGLSLTLALANDERFRIATQIVSSDDVCIRLLKDPPLRNRLGNKALGVLAWRRTLSASAKELFCLS